MADNVAVTAGSGTTIAADEVVDGTLGTVKVQYVKLMDGALDGTGKAAVGTNGLKVDGSAVTQPVSGTFWQTTQPVSAESLPLPTGAATAAKQPALGTAGSASSDVISVQGVASMTALKVDPSGVTSPVSLASVPTHAVTQSGTWTVQPGNTANTTPWLAKLSDGTNAPTIRAASTGGAVTTDVALVVTNRDTLAPGRNTSANSTPVVPSYMKGQYVAASSSAQQVGTGASTDYLEGIWIIPAAAAAGAVSILWDGTNTRTVFAGGGTTALPTLAPFFIGFGFESGNSGGWKITTGANVAVIAVGDY